jgi:hypothetical protein
MRAMIRFNQIVEVFALPQFANKSNGSRRL